jgi:predicted nucleotidyltransferase
VDTSARVNQNLDVAERVVAALETALGDRLRAIVLFGSRARGDHRADSDWDLLVIADGLASKPLERHQSVKGIVPPGIRGATATLAVTPEEFEGHVPELYLDIALDGRILYDPSGYVTQRLAQLRSIMHKSGLYREASDSGNVWKWRTEPRRPWSITWEQ